MRLSLQVEGRTWDGERKGQKEKISRSGRALLKHKVRLPSGMGPKTQRIAENTHGAAEHGQRGEMSMPVEFLGKGRNQRWDEAWASRSPDPPQNDRCTAGLHVLERLTTPWGWCRDGDWICTAEPYALRALKVVF